jgi:hypothetical protein
MFKHLNPPTLKEKQTLPLKEKEKEKIMTPLNP